MYIRPRELNDTVIDFNALGQNYFNVTVGLNSTDHALQYFIGAAGNNVNVPIQLVNQNGNAGTDYSVTKSDNTARAYIFKRMLTNPGFYNDVIKYYNKTVLYDPSDPRYNQTRPYLTQDDSFNYFIFQKAVLSLSVNNTLIKNGVTINSSPDLPIILDGSSSRGCELGYNVTIQKRDSTNKWVAATIDVDYSFIKSTDKQNYFTVSFHDIAEYRVITLAIGYNSHVNNFGNITDKRGMIIENQDILVFKINTGITPIIDNIKFPNIVAQIHGEDDGNGNFNKVYSNKEFIVSPNILYETGSWVAGGNNITMNEADWLQEFDNYCNVKLHIQSDNGVDILQPKTGLDQQKVIVPLKTNCHFKYITTIK